MRFVRSSFVVAGLAVLAACATSSSPVGAPSSTPSAVSGTLVVNGAGTLAVPFKSVIAAFEQANPGVHVQSRFAGSVELVRGVTDLNTPVDVLGVADYSLIPGSMFAASGHRAFADWYVGFAANEITFAYTDQSAGAAEVTAQTWPSVLARPGVHIGRSNPDTDPSGYQLLEMLQLAQGYYDQPDLTAKVLANSPPETMVGTETQLLPALSSGQIDYLGIYRSDALQHNLHFIALPAQVNLADPAQADSYRAAKVDTAAGTRTGKPIVYGLTVPTDAPNAVLGLRFVEFVLSPAGQSIMRDAGFTVLSPASAGGSVPAPLQAVSTPSPSAGPSDSPSASPAASASVSPSATPGG
jgi:molybdate/tungstate transport system substrate-binding protein